jgi:glucokinase
MSLEDASLPTDRRPELQIVRPSSSVRGGVAARTEGHLMKSDRWAIGVDLGGTKIEIAQIGADGQVGKRSRLQTDVVSGPAGIKGRITKAAHDLMQSIGNQPVALGIGVAGQVEAQTGVVRFAPNLDWHDVPLGEDLQQSVGLRTVVTNDVRAATWGEWRHGAGRGSDDLICLLIGTGIGGGVVSGGRMLAGCSNTAGELGHMTIDLNGPPCHCRNHGCLEALASGWAIERDARQAAERDPNRASRLVEMANGDSSAITAKMVAQAAHDGDPLATEIVDHVADALVAGCVALINGLNPCRLILGGGVIDGLPELVERISEGVRSSALEAAVASLEVGPAQLGDDAVVVGAASLSLHLRSETRGGEQ